MVVLESMNVSLTCKATGYPEPYVMWRREDGENIRYNGENGKRQTTNVASKTPYKSRFVFPPMQFFTVTRRFIIRNYFERDDPSLRKLKAAINIVI